MILEDILEDILTFFDFADVTIPDQYMNALSDIIDMFGSLEFILPVNTALSCLAFIFTFSIVCGFIKVVVNK